MVKMKFFTPAYLSNEQAGDPYSLAAMIALL
jgi:hypothetical protein